MDEFTRRDAVKLAAAIATWQAAPGGIAHGADRWDAGPVNHILPAVGADRVAVNVSLERAVGPVRLLVDGRPASAERLDREGRFWRFAATGLQPDRTYRLELQARGSALCDPWPLATFPDPGSEPARFRLASFTCAGGHEDAAANLPVEVFRSLDFRRRMLRRIADFRPDAVIANGDHIYWDQRSWLESRDPAVRGMAQRLYSGFPSLDPDAPIWSQDNETALLAIGESQISALYGVTFRSTPVWFLGDDHDYFENDEANDRFVTFPPTDFHYAAKARLAETFYPGMPAPAPLAAPAGPGSRGRDAAGSPTGRAFASMRFGRLFEALLYDCAGYLSHSGREPGLVPSDAEAWIQDRTRRSDANHLLHVPSHPFGWTAGKWREWYPDTDQTGGPLDAARNANQSKYLWPGEWNEQHQRLLRAMTRRERPAMSLSGDLHAVGRGVITQSGALDLSRTPLHSILAGPISTSEAGWPSFARGAAARIAESISMDGGELAEQNGFVVMDFEADRVTIRRFACSDLDEAAGELKRPVETIVL